MRRADPITDSRGCAFDKLSRYKSLMLQRPSLSAFSAVAVLLAGAILLAAPANAASSADTKHVAARLVTEANGIEPGGTLTVGLHKRIIPKWHTYWRNSGDSGLATTIAWSLPAGAEAGEIQWPYPQRLMIGPVANYGYEGEVTLLTEIRAPETVQPGDNFPIRATVDWLVCEEICIPEQVTLTLNVPVVAKGTAIGMSMPAIAMARSNLPEPSPWEASALAKDRTITLALKADGIDKNTIAKALFFAEDWGVIEHAADQPLSVENGEIRLALKPYENRLPKSLKGVLVFTERGESGPLTRALAIETPVTGALAAAPATPAPVRAAMPEISLFTALLFALLGGIILNLMPCVLPVLSIKVLFLVRHSGMSARARHQHGLAYTAGVLACFAAFAAIVLAFKTGGAELGWGFQFQSPVFVLLLAYLMFAVGLSQSGLLPVGASFTRLGGDSGRDGLGGSFLTGALAAVVATPCTAPFMGAALGYAVNQPAPALIAVFLVLGLGLALPYLLLTLWPVLLRFVPKPGAWMERFKQALAFPMYAVAVWLIWVLAQQAGPNAMAAALVGMLLIAFGAWLWSSYAQSGALARRVSTVAAALSLVAALAIGVQFAQSGVASPAAASANANYENFTPARLAALRAEGRPVFVNLTAAWCITCLVNERLAIDRADVKEAFVAAKVAYLKGDWTKRDPAITAMLAEFGRNGVPLYVFYPAGPQSKPVVLPQILTPDIVMREIGQSRTANVNIR